MFLRQCFPEQRMPRSGWSPEHAGKSQAKQNKTTTYRENGPLVLDFLFAVTWLEDPSYVLYLSMFTQIHSYFVFTKKKHSFQKSTFKYPWKQKAKQMCHCSLRSHRAPPGVSCNLLIPRGRWKQYKEFPQEPSSQLCGMEKALDKIQTSPVTQVHKDIKRICDPAATAPVTVAVP